MRSSTGITPLTAAELVEAADFDDLVSELGRPTAYLLETSGKRLRSTVLLHAAQTGPHPEEASVRRAAAAIELFQLASLAHDDVVDDARVRRGTEAVGVVYGAVASGFAGGVLFARALELISLCGDEPTRRFVATAGEVCAGEIAEFHDLLNVERSLESYHAAISGKTASLFELSAWLGAFASGASPATAEAVGRFGRALGIAFQIADDVLDLVGDPEHTGKEQAKDLKQGIYTLPVIHAVAKDKTLRKALRTADNQADFAQIVALVERSGGIEAAIEECLARSKSAATSLRQALGPAESSAHGLIALLEQAIAPIAAPASEVLSLA